MKKEYINPEMQIVKVKTATVLAASMPISSEKTTTLDAPELFEDSDEDDEIDW